MGAPVTRRTAAHAVWLVASRLVRRRDKPGRFTRVATLGSVAGTLGCLVLSGVGVHEPLVLLGLGFFGVLSTVLLIARMLRPMLAVSAIGLALGVASLGTVLAVGSGFEHELVSGLARLNGHVLFGKYGLDFVEYEELSDRFEADPAIVAASPFVWGGAALVVEGRETERSPKIVMVKGLLPERAAAVPGLPSLFGRGDLASLRPADPGVRPGAAIGRRLASEAGVKIGDHVALVAPDAIDGTMQAIAGPPRRIQLEVIDTLHTGVAELDEGLVVVHLTAAQSLVYQEGRVSGIELAMHDSDQALAIGQAWAARLDAERPVPTYRAASWIERSSVVQLIRQTRATIGVIVGLIVVVASSSLIGALLLLVRARRADLAILGAMGASPRTLFWLFELVGVLTGAIGGVFGIALAALYGAGLTWHRLPLEPEVYPIDHLPFEAAPLDVLVPVLVAIVVCGVASGPVAASAARIPPIAALRE